MAIGVVLNSPIVQFFSNQGLPAVNGSVLTQVGGINTPTFQDLGLTTPLPNPIPLNSRGEPSVSGGPSAQVFLTPNQVYTLTVFDGPNGTGNQLWVATYVNGVQITAALIGQAFYPVTASENTAGIIPLNQIYPELNLLRYGAPGTLGLGASDDSPAFNAMFAVAKVQGGKCIIPKPPNYYLIQNPLNLTSNGSAAGFYVQMESNPHFSPVSPAGSIHAQFSGVGSHVFDCSGNNALIFRDILVTTDTTTFPQTCWFFARVGGSSQINRLEDCKVYGNFSVAIYYNYGSEDDIVTGPVFYNYAPASSLNTKIMAWTANNYAGLSSTFQTVDAPPRSCLHHHVVGGDFALVTPSASSDVFYLEQASFVELDQPWVGSLAPGRAIIYVDTTHNPSNNVTILSLETEVGAFPSYGINIPNPGAGLPTIVSWTLDNCYWDSISNVIGTGTNITLAGWRIRGNTAVVPPSAGINIQGTLQYSTIDCDALPITIGNDTNNVLIGSAQNWTITGTRSGSAYIDARPSGVTRQWTPALATMPTTAAAKANTNSAISGNLVTATLVLTPNGGNVTATAGTSTITGLPFAPVTGIGSCVAIDQTTNIVLGTGYVNASGVFPPTLNVAHNVAIVAQYLTG